MDTFVFVGSALVAITVLLVRSAHHQDRSTAELGREAAIDPLTGLVTRRVLDDAAHTALASAAHDDGTSPVLLDTDHFTTINDTLGDPVGDAALSTSPRWSPPSAVPTTPVFTPDGPVSLTVGAGDPST